MNYSKDIRSLLIEQLKELIFSNRLVDEALPQIQLKVTDKFNSELIWKVLDQNKLQWNRLVLAFQMLNENLASEDCAFMSSIATIPQNLADLATDPERVDNKLLSHLIRMEQFQMAGYGAAAVYADTLRLCEVTSLLKETLMEKKETNKKIEFNLNKLNIRKDDRSY